jgi:hypothetical protein
MTDDPRLLAWLEAALRPERMPVDDRPLALAHAFSERAALQRSLEQRPAEAPSVELAQRLREAEQSLARVAAEIRERLVARLAEVRRLRGAVGSYRPAGANHPTFLSKTI